MAENSVALWSIILSAINAALMVLWKALNGD